MNWQEPIACGGVAVFPNDIVVEAAVEQERLEGWIMNEVNNGAVLPGLYPPNEANKARYEAWAKTVR